MRVPFRRPASAATSSRSYDAYGRYDQHEIFPGDRFGPPPIDMGGKAMRRGVVVVLLALGAGWALLDDPTSWTSWRSLVTSIAPKASPRSPAAEFTEPERAPTSPTGTATEFVQPTVSHEIAAAPPAAITALAAPSIRREENSREDQPVMPLPPPAIDPADPYQKRAAAVGLHPDLSRVLLARLSPTDYYNAGIAIEMAIAETPDTAVFVWPRQRKPDLALFQIRFVAGAAPECRRYVVAITKDGWLTTALPMEKCRPPSNKPRRE